MNLKIKNYLKIKNLIFNKLYKRIFMKEKN
jgi:hypothetical protein